MELNGTDAADMIPSDVVVVVERTAVVVVDLVDGVLLTSSPVSDNTHNIRGVGIAEFAGLENDGQENDGLENDVVEQEETYILHTMK